jgi:3-hydroxyisobutyrate dehydrogenase-like beta-hydroxyacid dehydrogenase
MSTTVGLVHPGEMGAALGASLRAAGSDVIWSSAGRSAATLGRARDSGLRDVATLAELARQADVILSVCPPHAAVEVARSVAGFSGLYVDANAISPQTTRRIGASMPRYVDGGIIGPPPRGRGTTRVYLAGTSARQVAALFEDTIVDARVLSAEIGHASALKLAYAAWTKGTAALLLAVREVARHEGVEEALLREWSESLPELRERSQLAERSAAAKGWRWVGEMEEIAATFEAAGQPAGFHRAAAEIFRRDD